MKKQFSDIKKLIKEAKKSKLQKATFSTSSNLITQNNPLLPNLKAIIKKHLAILYNNLLQMFHIFPLNTVSVTSKRNKILREILSTSLFSRSFCCQAQQKLYKRM